MFGLGFLAPAFLAGLAAVAVPILLHLYRRRTDRVVEFPATPMLPEAPVQQQDRRRLRDLLLLALRVAALAVLAISFARPYVMGDDPRLRASATVVVVDTSLSVSAPAAWADVRRTARAAIDGAPVGDAVGLVAFDDRGRVLVRPTVNRADAVAALDALTPGAGGTSAPAGLGVALDALAGTPGRVEVVTDLQQRSWSGAASMVVPADVTVRVHPVVVAPGNLAVTAVSREGGVTAVVQSYAPGPRTVTARLTVNGRATGQRVVELAPLAAADVRFATPIPAAGVASVAIDDPGGAAADNVRYLPLAPAPAPRVLVLTAEAPESARTGLYVQRALEAGADLWPVDVAVQDGRAFSADASPPAAPAAIVVVGTRTLDRRGRERLSRYLRDGGRVLLSLGPDVDVPTLSDAIGLNVRLAPEPVTPAADAAAIVASDPRHPVWRQLAGSRSALGRLPIERFRQVLDESGWTVLARFAGGAVALAERDVERGTLLLFASDLDNRWNRFPLEPGFAPFVIDVARYLTRDAEGRLAFVLPVVPDGVPATPGAHTLPPAEGRAPATVVVNVDPGESDPATTTLDAFMAHLQPGDTTSRAEADDRARAREEQQRLWQRGLAVLLLLLVVEGVIGRAGWRRRAAETG